LITPKRRVKTKKKPHLIGPTKKKKRENHTFRASGHGENWGGEKEINKKKKSMGKGGEAEELLSHYKERKITKRHQIEKGEKKRKKCPGRNQRLKHNKGKQGTTKRNQTRFWVGRNPTRFDIKQQKKAKSAKPLARPLGWQKGGKKPRQRGGGGGKKNGVKKVPQPKICCCEPLARGKKRWDDNPQERDPKISRSVMDPVMPQITEKEERTLGGSKTTRENRRSSRKGIGHTSSLKFIKKGDKGKT